VHAGIVLFVLISEQFCRVIVATNAKVQNCNTLTNQAHAKTSKQMNK
jgi:hypothetical protein